MGVETTGVGNPSSGALPTAASADTDTRPTSPAVPFDRDGAQGDSQNGAASNTEASSTAGLTHQQTSTLRFKREVAERFGVLPNFFCSADAAPGLTEELWKFAKSAYLDSPLPSLFKER